MQAQTDLLRGELEKNFELDELLSMSKDLLGIAPDTVGNTDVKGAFARALVEHCLKDDGVPALLEAMSMLKKNTKASAALGEQELAPSSTFEGYTIAKKLGDGPTGVTYLAEKGGEKYALKVLHNSVAVERGAVRRFQTYVRGAARAQSPNLIPAIGADTTTDGRAYVVSTFVDAPSVASRVGRTGPLHYNEARNFVRATLTALEALHTQGFTHGGVKLENIFVPRSGSDERMKNEASGLLGDLGSDRLWLRAGSLTGSVKSTAPEQLRSGKSSPSSDIYALGAALYEALTGKPPFAGATTADTLALHLTADLTPPSQVAPKGWVNKDVDAIVAKALAKDPKDRYQTVQEFRDALEATGRNTIPPEARPKAELNQAAFDKAKAELEASPDDAEKAAALEVAVEESQSWTKAVEVFEALTEKTESIETKKGLLFRVARISEDDLADKALADKTYRAILALDASDDIARAGLEELKRSSRDYEGLVELLLERTEREPSGEEKVRVWTEIAETYETKLDNAENAFVAWLEVYTTDPRDERATASIERLATTPEQWGEALTSLTESLAGIEDPAAKLHLLTQLGTWYGTKVARPDIAVSSFGQALSIDPAHEPALDGLVALYRRAQSWPDLYAFLVKRADVTAHPVKARQARREAAELAHLRLNDSAKARELYEKILAEDPSDLETSEALEILYSTAKENKKLAELLEARAHNLRGAQKADALVALGEVQEHQLNDPEKAAVSYQEALKLVSGLLPALKGLERVLTKRNAYQELLLNLEMQLELTATPRQKIQLLERIAAIHDEEFADLEHAVKAFEQITHLDPSHSNAVASLGRLYRKQKRFEDLAKLFESSAQQSSDEAQKIQLLLDASRTYLLEVGAPERAAGVAEKILTVNPNHSEALELLARIKTQAGDAEAAFLATKRLAEAESDKNKRADLLYSLARLLDRAGDKDGAITQLKAALDANPDLKDARTVLRQLYVERGDVLGAVNLIEHQLQRTEGPSARGSLYAELGTLQAKKLDQLDQAKSAWRTALDLDPTISEAAQGLADLLFEEGDFAAAAKLYEPLLARTSSMPVDEAKQLALRCGDSFKAIGDHVKAQRAYLNAKAFAAEDRAVLERLAEVTFESGAPDEAAELYSQLLEKFGKELVGLERGKVLLSIGEAQRRAGEFGEAEARLKEALKLMPGAPGPVGSLRKLYEDKGAYEELLRLLKGHEEHLSDDDRLAVLLEAGDVAFTRLSDKARASKLYLAALEVKGDDRNVLSRLLNLYSETKDWSKVVEVVLRLAELEKDRSRLAKYYYTAGSISYRELKRHDDAASYYEESLSQDHDQPKAFEGLVSALQSKADWNRLELAYRNRIKVLENIPTSRDELVHLWDSLGELLKHRVNKPADAVDAFEQAQKLDPDNRQRAEQLAEVYASDPKRYFQRSVEVHHGLLEKNVFRIESYQALRRAYTEAKKADESWCVCQALVSLKNAEPDEEAFYKKHRTKKPLASQSSLTDDLWSQHVLHQDLDPMLTDIFSSVLPAVLQSTSQPLQTFGLSAADLKNPETESGEMFKLLGQAATLLKVPLPQLYARPADPSGLSFVLTQPLSLALGQSALAQAPSQALAFIAARQLAYLKGGFFLRQLVPTGSGLRAWLLASIQTSMPDFPVPSALSGQVSENLRAIRGAILGPQLDTLKSHVAKLLSAAPELDLKRWTGAVDATADRLGFLFANSLELSQVLIKASPEDAASIAPKERARELQLYAISESYLTLRSKLGISIG